MNLTNKWRSRGKGLTWILCSFAFGADYFFVFIRTGKVWLNFRNPTGFQGFVKVGFDKLKTLSYGKMARDFSILFVFLCGLGEMLGRVFVLLFVLAGCLQGSQNVILEHTTGIRPDGSLIWTKRGTITHGSHWQMMSSASSSTPPAPVLSTVLVQLPYNIQAKQSKSKDLSGKAATVSIEQEPLSFEEATGIASILEKEGYYSIRVAPQTEGAVAVSTSIPVCALIESNFRDRVGLHLNREDKVVSLNYETRVSTCSSTLDASNVTEGKIFRSNLYLSFPSEAPQLPSYTEMEVEKKEKKESAENEKTFFQKYWLYIAAFGFFMVIQIVGAAAAGGAPQ